MTRTLAAATLALALLVPAVAQAKQICIKDETDGYWIFPQVKKLKPGKAYALNGISLRYQAPVAGTAFMDFTGAVRIGVLVHAMAPFDATGNNATVTILGDATLSGAGFYDSNGDFVADAPATWTAVDCSEALAPT